MSAAPKTAFAPGHPKVGGRKPGSTNKATADIKAAAALHGAEAINELARIMRNGDSDKVRVTAAIALLDRGFGKPTQAVEVTSDLPPAVVVYLPDNGR